MTVKHILLTTDFSDASLQAFAPVAQLARSLQARVTMLHVVLDNTRVITPAVPSMPAVSLEQEPDAAADEARQRLEALRDRLPFVPDVEVDASVGLEVADTIVESAEKHRVDVIAMATHGRSGIRRLIVGSVAESVLRRATIPVWLYPQQDA